MRLKGAIASKGVRNFGTAHYIAGHHKVPRIWIIIADKKVAKIFSKAGDSLEMIGEAFPSDDGEEQIEYEPSMSPVRRKAFRFAHEIAAFLDKAVQKDAFDRLIFVAPPQTLQDLRNCLGRPVFSRLMAEVNKDLAKLKKNELQEGLENIIWF